MSKSEMLEFIDRDDKANPSCKRILALYNGATECWVWTRPASSGYGMVTRGGPTECLHRYSYRVLVGEIPEGLELDHTCRVTRCFNPEHLEPVTKAENQRRSWEHRGVGPYAEKEVGMAESVMVNVRLKSSEVAKIDAAADKMKMSRSAFIRDALTKALAQVGDGTQVTGVRVRGKAAKKPEQTYPYDDCPKGQYCQWVKAPTGINICRTCGLKKA